jgi:hypothetical protein
MAAPLIAAVSASDAQVVYKDIDPDVTLVIGSNYPLDLDNDGAVDFVFKVTTYGTGWYFAGVVPYPPSGSNLNAFAGYVQTFGGDPSIYGFPSMFASGEEIGEGLPWKAMQDLIWTSSGIDSYFYAGMVSNYYGTIFGQWSAAVDKYLALRFSPDAVNLHYGWVRCDVNATGDTMVIKDGAFEATAGNSILAGEITGVGPLTSIGFEAFAYEGMLQVTVKEGDFRNAELVITNALGQKMMTEELYSTVNRFDLTAFAKGVYLVTIRRGAEVFSTKVTFR